MSIEDAKDDVPSGTEFEKPSGAKDDVPSGKEFEKPSGAKDDVPSGTEFEKPSGAKDDVPMELEFEHRQMRGELQILSDFALFAASREIIVWRVTRPHAKPRRGLSIPVPASRETAVQGNGSMCTGLRPAAVPPVSAAGPARRRRERCRGPPRRRTSLPR